MKTVCLHNKKEIEIFLRNNTFLHIYSIGDLDDFFWDYTIWYGLKENENIKAIILLYAGLDAPTILALSEKENLIYLKKLFNSIIHLLPKKFYTHLTPKLEKILEKYYKLEAYGNHYKMALTDKSKLYEFDTSNVIQLSTKDLDDILKLYEISYPDNWFDPRMLETNQYYAIRNENNMLISTAGIHVYSSKYKVAALGNITTHPDFRGKGLAKITTAKLCKSLLDSSVNAIGLNVKSDNISAIKCYEKLGFEIITDYNEFMATLNTINYQLLTTLCILYYLNQYTKLSLGADAN